MRFEDALAELTVQLRATLQANRNVGVTVEPVDASLPVPSADDLAEARAWLNDPTVAPDTADSASPVESVPSVSFASAWQQLASPAEPATETLAELRASMGDCRACRLCEHRTNLIFGTGDPTADLLIIGDAPSSDEDKSGTALRGPAADMLDKMVRNVLGLDPNEVYITNVVKCRPREHHKLQFDEAHTCTQFLFRQVAAIQPKLIMLLGNVALQHVGGRDGIATVRGQEFRVRDIPTIATYHPAYLLRRPEHKRETFADLKLIRARYDELGGKRRS